MPVMGSKKEQPDPNFKSANPRLQVPTLITPEGSLFDSKVILEYLEEKYPEPSLLPRDPFQRAQCRMIQEITDTIYEALNWGFGEMLWFGRAEGDLEKRMKGQAVEQTKVLQEWLAGQLGDKPYFCGDRFSLADVAVAPILNRSVFYGLGPAPESNLSAWLKRVSERESVRKTFDEFQKGTDIMVKTGRIFAKGGARRREYRDHRLEWLIKSGGMDIVQKGLEEDTIRFGWPDAAKL